MNQSVVYLGLGTNLGDRETNLARAVELLARWVEIDLVSSIYETDPVGYYDQGPFLNIVCKVSTELSPYKMLSVAKDIEASMGRVAGFRNAPRPIDIDILLYDEVVINTPLLIVPHPRLLQRAFVLVPLAELAPGLQHPITRGRIGDVVCSVDLGGVRKWMEGCSYV